MTFSELCLAPELLRAVSDEGYEIPTPIQEKAIPHVLTGCDLLGCAQTGTGKTAAFALPILDQLLRNGAQSEGKAAGEKSDRRVIRCAVLAPTRELAVQIQASFEAYSRHSDLRSTVIYGGVRQRSQVEDLKRGVDVVVATPGRLLDLMQQGFVDLSHVQHLVLDEADHMLDMGFIDDVRDIISHTPRDRQTLLFSATMPPEIEHLADTILHDPIEVHVAPTSSTVDLVEQYVFHAERLQKPHLLVHLLKEIKDGRVLVFMKTKHGADRVVETLIRSRIRAQAMHGDLNQKEREQTIEMFKTENPPVVVATDIAARGLDIDDITHVINFDMPTEPEVYVHRIGRTARAGNKGIAIAFADIEERSTVKAIEKLIRKPIRVEAMPASVPTLGQLLHGERPHQPHLVAHVAATTTGAPVVHKPVSMVVPVTKYCGFGRLGAGTNKPSHRRKRR